MDDNSIHSHITSLGISNFNVKDSNGSIIGQKKARQSLSIVLECIKQRKMNGKAIILCGKSGIGKTALAVGLSKELNNIPFLRVSGAELKSKEIRNSEVITEYLRSCVEVKIKEEKHIFEGELLNFNVYPSYLSVNLQSKSGIKEIMLPKMAEEQFIEQGINNNDIIFIEKSTGIVQRLGRSESKKFCDLDTEIYLPLPKTVESTKEIIRTFTMHELDMEILKSKDTQDGVIMNINQKRFELSNKLRSSVDEIVDNYVKSGLGEVYPGVLFIDDAHLLDMDSVIFLNKVIESSHTPSIIFGTNKDLNTFPEAFIERCLLIQLEDYSIDEKFEIVMSRIDFLKIKMDENCKNKIKEIVELKGIIRVFNILSFIGDLDISYDQIDKLNKNFL